MSLVYIPAGTGTTTGKIENLTFHDSASGGKRIRDIFAVTSGMPGAAYPNGAVPITGSSGAYGPLFALTDAQRIYVGDTDGTRTLVARNFPAFRVPKVADQTVTNSSTLTNDTELKFTAVASATYYVRAVLVVTSLGTTSDFKAAWSLPSGASGSHWATAQTYAASGSSSTAVTAAGSAVSVGSINGTYPIELEGNLTISTTAGDVVLQWAQNTQTEEDTKVLAGSFIEYRRTS